MLDASLKQVCISIPSKYAVPNIVGYLKEKSAISIVQKFKGWQKNFTGKHFRREMI